MNDYYLIKKRDADGHPIEVEYLNPEDVVHIYDTTQTHLSHYAVTRKNVEGLPLGICNIPMQHLPHEFQAVWSESRFWCNGKGH